MESWLIVFLVTIGYLILSLAVGLFSGRKASASTEGYVAGDRNLGFLVLYFILGASIYSAFAFLGGPGWAYSRGAAAFYIISYGTVGLLPWYFPRPPDRAPRAQVRLRHPSRALCAPLREPLHLLHPRDHQPRRFSCPIS